jgi:hypothetical protein
MEKDSAFSKSIEQLEKLAQRAKEGVISAHVRDAVRKIMAAEASLAKYSKKKKTQ